MTRRRTPPPMGRVVRPATPRDATPEPPTEIYRPTFSHYRWNKTESEPGWNITPAPFGPPRPTLVDPDHQLSILWIFDSKKKGWKLHEVLDTHPNVRYATYTPEAIRRAQHQPRPRDVPRAQREVEVEDEGVKREEPNVKREPGETSFV